MVNTCSVVYCKTGYKNRENKEDKIPEKHPVFGFPDSKPNLKAKWVKFVSRKWWLPTKNSGILPKGLRTTLRWDLNPVPTLYCNIESIPRSLLPSQITGRVAPKERSTLEDENSKFCNIHRISDCEDLNESLHPTGYQLKKDENEAIFYKIEPQYSVLSIPQVSETIADKMLHVKLFLLLLLLFQYSLAKMVSEKKWLLSKKKINARKLSKLHKKHFWSEKVTRWYFIRTRVNSIQET